MKLEKPSWKSRKDWSEVIFEKIQGEIIFDGNSGYQKQMILVEAKEKASEHKQKITFFRLGLTSSKTQKELNPSSPRKSNNGMIQGEKIKTS